MTKILINIFENNKKKNYVIFRIKGKLLNNERIIEI